MRIVSMRGCVLDAVLDLIRLSASLRVLFIGMSDTVIPMLAVKLICLY